MQNGFAPTQRETIAEIKAAAIEQAQKAARGASPLTLLRSARLQIQTARAKEGEGELRDALIALTKAALLTQMFMNSNEFKQEMTGKKGVLTRDMLDFQQVREALQPVKEVSYRGVTARRSQPRGQHAAD